MVATIKKHLISILMLLAVIGFVIWGLIPKPIEVELGQVELGPMMVTLEETGKTRVTERYVVSAPVNGEACRLNLNVGDTVTKDQLLLTISPLHSEVLDARTRAQAEAKVSAARSALEAAKAKVLLTTANANRAQNKLKRIEAMLQKKLVSDEEFEQARTNLLISQASLSEAQFQVEVVSYELKNALITLNYASGQQQNPGQKIEVLAPIDGTMLKIHRKCEGPVNTGDPLFDIGDESALEVIADVLSADAVKIRPGMKVLFERWGGPQPLEGRVCTVEPAGFTKISALGVEEQRV